MPRFRYRALEPGGRLRRGITEAASAAEVAAWLQREGCLPLQAEPAGAAATLPAWLRAEAAARRGLRPQEVADLMLELSTMLGAGQDLDRTMRQAEAMARNPRVRRVLGGLREAVRDGKPLSAALAAQPDSFAPLHVGLVRAGEAGGRLAEALARLAEMLERRRRLAATVTSALTYPALLLAAAIGAVLLLLTQVLPQFVPLFEQSGAALPASTQFLVDAGDALSRHGAAALLGLGAALPGLRAVLRRPAARRVLDGWLLRLPIAGPLAREVLAARFTRVLGTLLSNGVPLVPALEVARGVLGNRAAAEAVAQATAGVRGGGGLAASLAEAGIFPERSIHLLRLGEETATLGPIALRAAAIHEERTQMAAQRLVALLVPAVTILMGALVAGIVASMLSAMLGLNALAGA